MTSWPDLLARAAQLAERGPRAVPGTVPLVITEGNYLLLDTDPWRAVRPLLEEAWFLKVDERLRLDWLVRRHESFGLSRSRARERALGADQRNAELIAPTAERADLIVRVPVS